jgi:hypothetical protein
MKASMGERGGPGSVPHRTHDGNAGKARERALDRRLIFVDGVAAT